MTDHEAAKALVGRQAILKAVKEFSDYLPEPLEPGDGDELMHIIETLLTAALDAREQEVWEEAAKHLEDAAQVSITAEIALLAAAVWCRQKGHPMKREELVRRLG